MRGREKDHITIGQIRAIRRRESQINMTTQIRKHLCDKHPIFFAGGDGGQLCIGVLSQHAQKLDTGVTGTTNNADLDTLGR